MTEEQKNKAVEEMAENILTCPFCGGEPLMETFSVRKGYEANIHCDKCSASISTITYDTEGEAILNCLKNWNRRTIRLESEVRAKTVKEFAGKLLSPLIGAYNQSYKASGYDMEAARSASEIKHYIDHIKQTVEQYGKEE